MSDWDDNNNLNWQLANDKLAWYRKYRPTGLEDYAGTKIKAKVHNIFKSGKTPNVWFIEGTHGCGKTTLARILTKYYLCENKGADGEPCNCCDTCMSINNELIAKGNSVEGVTEVNVSAENGKDSLLSRFEDLENLGFTPYNILILDEVQKASESAQQSLLKPLEDLKDYCVVILATTEPAKVLSTIRSRANCNIKVTRHTPSSIAERLAKACEIEKVSVDKGALELIGTRENGVFRESFNRLETIVAENKGKRITREIVSTSYDLLPDEFLSSFLKSCANRELSKLVLQADRILGDGVSIDEFIKALGLFVSEGLESLYGKITGGKLAKEFVSSITDKQVLDLVRVLGTYCDKMAVGDKYGSFRTDTSLGVIELASNIYNEVFREPITEIETTGTTDKVVPKSALIGEKESTDLAERGNDLFRDREISKEKKITLFSNDEDDDDF